MAAAMSELADDPVGEILLRIPPEDPACLLHASLVCKRWRRILADPEFRRRHRALHRTPAVVGFFTIVSDRGPVSSRFVPIDSSRRPAARDFPGWFVLDCRHGRALFLTLPEGSGPEEALDLVVWDPLTNEQHRLPRSSTPPFASVPFNAAVLCAAAAEGCDHGDCHGGHFRVVFIFSTWIAGEWITLARDYSSESGDWSELTTVHHPKAYVNIIPCHTALVGDALYFCGHMNDVFEYQLATHRMSVIDRPPRVVYKGTSISLMLTEDGGLGFAAVEKKPCLCLCLWSRETSLDGVEQWEQRRAIEIETLLPDGAHLAPWLTFDHRQRLMQSSFAKVVGFVEGTDVVFVGTTTNGGAVYMVQLNSGRVRKVLDGFTCIFPYTSFCISVTDAPLTTKAPGGVSGA